MLDRPVLRGWIHAIATPVALAATTLLACRAATPPGVAATVVFAICSVELFGVSAVYHLGNWSARVRAVLRRVDHADILFLIAGTYTLLAVLVLRGAGLATLLVAVGGILYTLGGIVYGLRRPDPWPRVFGFHEVFHSLTVAAFTCQFIAVWLVVRGTC